MHSNWPLNIEIKRQVSLLVRLFLLSFGGQSEVALPVMHIKMPIISPVSEDFTSIVPFLLTPIFLLSFHFYLHDIIETPEQISFVYVLAIFFLLVFESCTVCCCILAV